MYIIDGMQNLKKKIISNYKMLLFNCKNCFGLTNTCRKNNLFELLCTLTITICKLIFHLYSVEHKIKL